MKRFRKLIFWLHLISGSIAGVFIFIMCITGAMLSFQSNIIDFAERNARYVNVYDGVQRSSFSEIIQIANAAKPGAEASSIALKNESGTSAVVSFGRAGQVFVDPYSGAITGEGATKLRAFFRFTEDLHRWLALPGDAKPVGRSINDAANFLFLFLAISGIYIWFPKKLKWKNFKPVIWFRKGLNGKARNFNWHNVIGFWTSTILIILTVTAVVMSYQWANDLAYRITGNEPPKQQARPQPTDSKSESVLPENLPAIWQTAESHTAWRSISLRLPVSKEAEFTIEEGIYWNRFARSKLIVDSDSNQVTNWEPYGAQNSGRQLRSWIRFTHTGETGGIPGQIIGFIACIGGAFLVWTGLSLALRRFQKWKSVVTPETPS